MSDLPKLYAFFPALGVPDPSPFPLKVMMFLKMHGIDHETASGDLRKAPLGKIPYMEHKGKVISDSELILDYLEQEYGLPKDDLTAEQHAAGHMICRALEERLYWIVVYSRWLEDSSWPTIRDAFFGSVPGLLRGPISNKIRSGMKKTLYGQGLGRHSREQIYDFARRDMQALSDILGDKPFLFGEKPSRYDCTGLAMAAQCTQTELPTQIMETVKDFPNLQNYWERGYQQFFQQN